MRTLYNLKDKEGKIVFRNNNAACFAEIFMDKNRKFYGKVLLDYTLTFIINQCINLEEAQKFIDKVNTIIDGKAVLSKVENINDFSSKLTDQYSGVDLSKDIYQISVNGFDFDHENCFKCYICLLRPIFETPGFVEEFLEETPQNIDNFQWYRIQLDQCGGVGHNYFGGVYGYNGYSEKKIYHLFNSKEFIERLKTKNFFNCIYDVTGENIREFSIVSNVNNLFNTIVETIQKVNQSKEVVKVEETPIQVVKKKTTRKKKVLTKYL